MNPYQVDFSQAFEAPQQNFLRTAGMEQDLQVRQAQLAAMPAQTRLTNAQAAKAERELAESAELRALFADFQPEPGEPESSTLSRMAQKYATIDPALTQTALIRANQAGLREAQMAKAEADAVRSRAIGLKRAQERLTATIGRVRTPEEFADTQMRLLSMPSVMADEFASQFISGLTFESYQRLISTIEMEQEAAELKLKQDAERRRAAEAESRRIKREADATATVTRENRLTAQEDRRIRNEGPRAPGAVSQTQINAALAFLRNVPEAKGLDSKPLVNLAGDVAARARVLVAQRPGLDEGMARAEAFREILDAGVLKTEETSWGTTKKSYLPMSPEAVGRAARAAAAKPAPAGAPRAAPAQPGERTATNPQTGERMVFRNGKWEKLQ